jgi:formylmethanofuran dehydrogenase subunit C
MEGGQIIIGGDVGFVATMSGGMIHIFGEYGGISSLSGYDSKIYHRGKLIFGKNE